MSYVMRQLGDATAAAQSGKEGAPVRRVHKTTPGCIRYSGQPGCIRILHQIVQPAGPTGVTEATPVTPTVTPPAAPPPVAGGVSTTANGVSATPGVEALLAGSWIAGLPNWMLLAGGVVLLFAMGHHHGRRS